MKRKAEMVQSVMPRDAAIRKMPQEQSFKKGGESDESATVDEAILSRRSVRAFLPTPVREAVIRDILEVAARAPSGTNMQPWRVYVIEGDTKRRIADAILNSGIRAEKAVWDEYHYYPDQFFEPYLSRRRKVGFDLYNHLGIARREVERMREQHDRNFIFFDAPVGMIFTIDRRLNKGSWIDYGMFLENIMIAARGRGLHTCPQAAWNGFAKIILPHIGAGPDEMLVCGMALGYADETDVVNTFRTPRVPVEEFTHWLS
jgi:nitroreductase